METSGRAHKNDGAMPLPRPESSGGPPFWWVVATRRSGREFSPGPLRVEALSQILWATAGVNGDTRTVPSAGARYPIETYVVANRVPGLEHAVYHYRPEEHALEPLEGGGSPRQLKDACAGQRMVEEAAVVLAWGVVAERTTRRYGARGERYVLLDAGHVGQNFYLAATALGLGCCTIGAFHDDRVNAVFGVDGRRETIVYLGCAGIPAR
ncbi:MAG: SagB/ThcOx family dehydrogenase [Firmicutes bacterium]|nr:SagB/ThcOx family dehydrogenase [Bacillota bacterium]